jgi:predicted Zn-dependent protease
VNIFTEQQEVDLGDAAAEHIQGDFQVIDADINDYLRQVGERIVKHIPPTHFRFQFFLVDLPDVNAFALPGGRVYVTRKLVAFVRNEDELAGVLGHEIGHIISHHTAIDMTRTFQAVLAQAQELPAEREGFTRPASGG